MVHMKPVKKVVDAGHICLDISPAFPESCQGDIHELIVPVKLINMGQAQVHIGGSVANTCLAMAKFCAEVNLMGKIGNDEFGDIVSRLVESHGISRGLVVSKTSHTSYSLVLALPGRDRVFLHYPGANDTFMLDDLDMDAIKQAVLFHFGYPPLMKHMYIDHGQELTKIFQAAANSGVVTSLDLVAVDPNAPSGWVDLERILSNTLPFVDIFAPSVEELLFMLDHKKFESLAEMTGGKDLTTIVNMERDEKPLIEKALQMGEKSL